MPTGPARRLVINPVDGARLAPVELPGVVDGFHFPVTLDGAHEDGSPWISPERGFIPDPHERERILAYLNSGTRVLKTIRYGPDAFDRTRRVEVRVGYRTDGVWVWPDAVEYYLREHQVGLDPEFLAHIVTQGYDCATPESEVLQAAAQATKKRSREIRRQLDEYSDQPDQTSLGDLNRFDQPTNRILLTMGWQPGRNISDQVDRWLESQTLPTGVSEGFERAGYTPYAPSAAARRVLEEFGGLANMAARPQFRIFPNLTEVPPGPGGAPHPAAAGPSGDLATFVFQTQLLAKRVGRNLFQVGELDRGMSAMVVADNGAVYAAGAMDLLLGTSVEEALTNLINRSAFNSPV